MMNCKSRIKILTIHWLLVIGYWLLLGQIGIPTVKIKDVVDVQLLPESSKFAISKDIVIFVKFIIKDRYHIYHPDETRGLPTKIEVAGQPGINLVNILYPAPIVINYPKIGGILKLYEKQAMVATVFKAQKIGTYTLNYKVEYAPCTDKECLQPQTKNISIDIEVAEQSAGIDGELTYRYNQILSEQNAQITKNTSPPKIDNIGSHSKWLDYILKNFSYLNNGYLRLLLYFILGIIGAFTPCILPVLPITIGWLQTLSKRKFSVFLGFILLYMLSSAALFGLIGVITHLIGGFLGVHLGNFYIVMVICIFFIFLAYWVMGAVEIPSLNIQSKFSNNIFFSIIFGGLSGLILSPCVGPILIWLLRIVAESTSKIYSFSTLFVFALGLNVPLIIGALSLSTIKSLIKVSFLPRLTKILFSILILATVIFLSWSSYRKMYPFLAIATILLSIGIKKYMAYIFGSIPEIINQIYPKINTATFIIFLVVTLGFFGSIMYSREDKLFNKGNIEEGLVKSRVENKPMLVKFSADWCLLCQELKSTLFNDSEIIKELESFYLLEVDCTIDRNGYCKEKLAEFGANGLPLIIFYSKEGKLYNNYMINGLVDKDIFLKILQDIKNQ